MEMPYSAVGDDTWRRVLVLSWRCVQVRNVPSTPTACVRGHSCCAANLLSAARTGASGELQPNGGKQGVPLQGPGPAVCCTNGFVRWTMPERAEQRALCTWVWERRHAMGD